MNPVFRQHIETAQKVNGIRFDPIGDWDALQDIARLADVVMQTDEDGAAAMVRPCVEIGGVLFHRMTIGAGCWLEKVAPWFDGQDKLFALALAYAMAGARNPSVDLWPFADDRAKLVARLNEFKRHLGCTPGELMQGIKAFADEETRAPMPGDESQVSAEAAKSGFGGLVDLLLSEYGGTPEQWLWHTPRATLNDLMGKIAARQRAKAGDKHSDPDDPRVIASHRLHNRVQDLVAKYKAGS